jgi:mRNA interferase RelE/StbE
MRIRVGDWRILYELREREVVVLVVRIGPRGEVYERLE